MHKLVLTILNKQTVEQKILIKLLMWFDYLGFDMKEEAEVHSYLKENFLVTEVVIGFKKER